MKRNDLMKVLVGLSIEAMLIMSCGEQQQPYEWVVEPTFADAYDFSEGLAPASVNDKWGYIDKNGIFVIEAQFDDANRFSEGMALVSPKGTPWKGDGKDGKWGFIDKTGKFVIEPKYTGQMFQYVFGNRWYAETTLNEDKGYLDYKGNFTKEIPRLYDDTIQFSNKYSTPQFGMVNGKLQEIKVAPDYIVPPFVEGLAQAVRDGKWGFVDKSGEWIIQPEYESVGSFSEGLAPVKNTSGDWIFIDKEGKVVLSSYKKPLSFSEGLAAACKPKNDTYGYIDRSGNWIIKPQFDNAYSFADGVALVKKKGKWGIIKLK